jgi:hypothetical protein
MGKKKCSKPPTSQVPGFLNGYLLGQNPKMIKMSSQNSHNMDHDGIDMKTK